MAWAVPSVGSRFMSYGATEGRKPVGANATAAGRIKAADSPEATSLGKQAGKAGETTALARRSMPKKRSKGNFFSVFWNEFLVPDRLTAGTNAFLICCPLGAASRVLEWGNWPTFVLNFLALLPLAGLLGEVTEDIAANVKSEVIGGLLNCTFGNVVEVILSVVALYHNMINVVQGMLVGSILSNLLLVLGCALFAGGIKNHVQEFLPDTVTANVGMLLLCCLAMAIPTVYDAVTVTEGESISQTNDVLTTVDMHISRTSSVVLFFMYFQFLVFQLYTHSELFADEEESDEDDDEESASSDPSAPADAPLAHTKS
eukprot:SAG11_NODE_8324_length_1029_cov_0.947312_1_plen_314_part_01